MSSHEHQLYQAEDVRKLDQLTIEQGVSGYALMSKAGQAAWDQLLHRWPNAQRILVYCGAGNNAGDGYVLARLAKQAGFEVQVLQICERLRGDARTAFNDYVAVTGRYETFSPNNDQCSRTTVAVDAILGTGLQRPVSGVWQQAVHEINQHSSVMALDIPTGLDADSGCQLGEAVMADITVTFIGRKRGMYTADGPDCCGTIVFESLSVPESVYKKQPLAQPTRLLSKTLLSEGLKPRLQNTHKGSNGHVLIVGGYLGYSGAVVLAAQAAMRCGAGLVSVATDPAHSAFIDSAYPEIMCHGVSSESQLNKLLASADSVVLGPGLGQQAWSKLMYKSVVNCSQPLVLDADALNLIAAGVSGKMIKDNRVITPHPGEAANLLSCDSAAIQHNRFSSVEKLAELTSASVVLKGKGSLVRASGSKTTWLCPYGNPGMASAGMGDVLSGIIAALLAQGFSSGEAAKAGVLVHALAGDRAAQQGQRGLIASDLVDCIREIVNSEK